MAKISFSFISFSPQKQSNTYVASPVLNATECLLNESMSILSLAGVPISFKTKLVEPFLQHRRKSGGTLAVGRPTAMIQFMKEKGFAPLCEKAIEVLREDVKFLLPVRGAATAMKGSALSLLWHRHWEICELLTRKDTIPILLLRSKLLDFRTIFSSLGFHATPWMHVWCMHSEEFASILGSFYRFANFSQESSHRALKRDFRFSIKSTVRPCGTSGIGDILIASNVEFALRKRGIDVWKHTRTKRMKRSSSLILKKVLEKFKRPTIVESSSDSEDGNT